MFDSRRVLFLASALDSCALWRLFMPHLNMPGSSFYAFAGMPDFTAIMRHDVVVVQRMYSQAQFEVLRLARNLKMRTIYDLDDDVWDLPEYNPGREPLMKMREGFRQCIRMVDLVTVSTRTLAKVVRRNVGQMVNPVTGRQIPVMVAENRIDTRLFAPPATPERFIVGFAGSSSHVGDLAILDDAIAACAALRPDVLFQFRGCVPFPDSRVRQVPNWEHRLWAPITEFAARMPQWGWSVALAPLTEHPFNNAKSSIKAVEAAYCGIPCLMSYMQPYEEFCHHDKELKWLLCVTPRHWREKLHELIHNEDWRRHLGARCQRTAMEHYSFRRPHEGWQAAVEAVLA